MKTVSESLREKLDIIRLTIHDELNKRVSEEEPHFEIEDSIFFNAINDQESEYVDGIELNKLIISDSDAHYSAHFSTVDLDKLLNILKEIENQEQLQDYIRLNRITTQE